MIGGFPEHFELQLVLFWMQSVGLFVTTLVVSSALSLSPPLLRMWRGSSKSLTIIKYSKFISCEHFWTKGLFTSWTMKSSFAPLKYVKGSLLAFCLKKKKTKKKWWAVDLVDGPLWFTSRRTIKCWSDHGTWVPQKGLFWGLHYPLSWSKRFCIGTSKRCSLAANVERP